MRCGEWLLQPGRFQGCLRCAESRMASLVVPFKVQMMREAVAGDGAPPPQTHVLEDKWSAGKGAVLRIYR